MFAPHVNGSGICVSKMIPDTYYQAFLFYARDRLSSQPREGVTPKSFIRGGSAPRSYPLPFYIPFFSEKAPLSYTFYWKKEPLSYAF